MRTSTTSLTTFGTTDTPGEPTWLAKPARVAHDGLMTEHTYRVTEIVGTSPEGTDQAIRNGIERAAQTLHNLDWFEVTQVRGQIVDQRIEHYQVGLRVGFRLDD